MEAVGEKKCEFHGMKMLVGLSNWLVYLIKAKIKIIYWVALCFFQKSMVN